MTGKFGVAATVTVFGAAGSYSSPTHFAHGFSAAMGLSAGFAALGFLAALALSRPARPSAPHTERGDPRAAAALDVAALATTGGQARR